MSQPLTADSILQLARGFMQSRILITAAWLDVFTLLEAPLTASELVEKTKWCLRPTIILLDALVAPGYLIKQGSLYQTNPDLLTLLVSDSPDSIRPMILHMDSMWNSWSDLTDIVRETGAPKHPAVTSRTPEELEAFIGAMHVVGSKAAPGIAKAIDPGNARNMIDVGGASGTYTLAMLEESPELRATLFDLPAVVEIARGRLEQAGVLDRVNLVPGDFYHDNLPGGHDLALVSAIIHQNSLDENLALYKNVYQALIPGGRIIIRDHVMNPDRTLPAAGAVFAVNMLAATPGGGTWTFEEIQTGLAQAGFTDIRQIREGQHMDCLVEASKSE